MDSNRNKNFLDIFSDEDLISEFGSGKIGIEKESLRVSNSTISEFPHHENLGSALCNQYITTDFSESQLELITPPLANGNEVIEFLDSIHHFVTNNIHDEILWPFSFPPLIKSEELIHIANYGSSNQALFKTTYREGLSLRYGKLMQTISGVHYNYSLSSSIWDSLSRIEKKSQIKELRNENYLHILRNIFRMNWLLLYFFGASPFLTKNFLNKPKDRFENIDKDTYYLPYATSLRMSNYGYQNLTRSRVNVSINSLQDYINDLKKATESHCKDFEINEQKSNLSQISSNILQIEDEYYALARLKSQTVSSDRSIVKLKKSGVDFIELRSLDLNPFSKIGIDIETILFLEIFFIYCLCKSSKPISKKELDGIYSNDQLIAKEGRKSNLYLQDQERTVSMQEWGNQILDEMEPIAELMHKDIKSNKSIIARFREKIKNPETTLSGILLDRMLSENIGHMDLGLSIAESNRNGYLEKEMSQNINWDIFKREAKDSLSKQRQLDNKTHKSFEKFLSDYFNE